MKYVSAVAMSSLAVWLVGCASAPKVVLQEPVGPCERVLAHGARDGFLQVYSARQLAPIDPAIAEYSWNNDFGQNAFLYASSHTAYTVLTPDGTILRHVRNARDLNDATPARVELPPGHYTVEAQAEEPGGMTKTIVVPLVVEAGQTTRIHLEPAWTKPGEMPGAAGLVRLADGRIVGCPAEHLVSQNSQ